MQLGPEILAGDAAVDVDRAQQLGVGEVAQHVLALGPDHGQPAGHVLDQGAEGGQQDRQPLALLGPADEEDPQLLAGRVGRAGSGADVDPVGDDRVVAAVPAAAGPGGRLGDGDPGREAVEEAAGADRVGDVVGQRLGRVGVEGADHRGLRAPGSRSSRPAAPAARGRGSRRSRPGGRRGAAPPRHRPGRARGWRPSRWRRTRRCARAASGSRAARSDSGAARCRRRLARPGGSKGASTRTSWPRPRNSSASASTCLFTPPW